MATAESSPRCPNGGTLIDTDAVEFGRGTFVRSCSCGFESTGPKAPTEYGRHLLGAV